MKGRLSPSVLVPALLYLGIPGALAQSQYPILDKVAGKVIAKYQNSSCQQLQVERSRPPSGMRAEEEKRATEILRNDPQMREHFLDEVAGPIANKLFECGMIP
jgi:hypothetical protein